MAKTTDRTIVVCGATGQQGAAVIDSLRARGGFRIVALSRQPDGDKARRLRDGGLTVLAADLDDVELLRRAFAGADGVFGVTQPWSADYRRAYIEREIAQGRHLVDACESARVPHLVLSTVLKLDEKPTGVPHVDSKLLIEDYLMSRPNGSVPFTLLRPGTFMDNIGQPFFPVKRGKVQGFTGGDAKLPYIACRDIGEAAATAFAAPRRWIGHKVNLVGDWVSGDDLCATLGRIRGERFRYRSPPAFLMRLFAPEFYKMRLGFEAAGRPPFPQQKQLDDAMAKTREIHPGVWTLEAYLRARGFATRPLA
jgi:uncharacterized protein YbjT (DUF2867 family)